jgi:squalene-hopene/tetraprenyl-beta-curcumene cyclase|tara:strand:+ start:9033 stop:10130 length:1098 start_codon:yes stop_codon:yes gene_type:complete
VEFTPFVLEDNKPSVEMIRSLFLLIPLSLALWAAEPAVTLENHIPPEANTATESLRSEFSYESATRAADHAAMNWQESHSCITCHTNGFYLVGRAATGARAPAYLEARKFARGFLAPHVDPDGSKPGRRAPGAEAMVATTAFLAISDMKTDGKLTKTTRQALDYIWSQQAESGVWERWAKCNWGPYESDDHFGVSLVALAMGVATGDEYQKSPAAMEGDRRLKKFLREHPPVSLHQKGMLLWVAGYRDDLADNKTVQQWQKELFAAQKENGAWVLPELGDRHWKRSDGRKQSTETDAYATAFAIHVLAQSGIVDDDPRLGKARQWLKSQQRESGRWYTRSPRKDNKHYISNAATSFALLALQPRE